MYEELDLILKYPLISVKKVSNEIHYTGRILCQNFDLNVEVIENRSDDKRNFYLSSKLKDEVPSDLANTTSNSPAEFLDPIVDFLCRKNATNTENLSNLYRKVLNEYSEFTGFHLNIRKSEISEDLSRIKILIVDDAYREHLLEIRINLDSYKEIFCPENLNLPEKIVNEFPKSAIYLSELYSKFLTVVEDLQHFFDIMDAIDNQCSVIDPEQPTRRDCYRRIWIDQNLSLMIIVDPTNTNSRPELKFLGPERLTELYLQKLSQKLQDWDPDENLLQVLLEILDLEEFPRKPEQNEVVLGDSGECSICFAARLNDKLPEVLCPNESCENIYHVECLYEVKKIVGLEEDYVVVFQWLISLNSNKIFNQLHGLCPNCEKKISCPIPES